MTLTDPDDEALAANIAAAHATIHVLKEYPTGPANHHETHKRHLGKQFPDIFKPRPKEKTMTEPHVPRYSRTAADVAREYREKRYGDPIIAARFWTLACPKIEEVKPGDVVTIEHGTRGESGYSCWTKTVIHDDEDTMDIKTEMHLVTIRALVKNGRRLTAVTPRRTEIPASPGTMFAAQYVSTGHRTRFVTLDDGTVLRMGSRLPMTPELFYADWEVIPDDDPRIEGQ